MQFVMNLHISYALTSCDFTIISAEEAERGSGEARTDETVRSLARLIAMEPEVRLIIV